MPLLHDCKGQKALFYAVFRIFLCIKIGLADVELQADNLFEQTIKSLTEQEQVTEKLKAENMMLWVQKMNNIRNRATEIVNEQVIYK